MVSKSAVSQGAQELALRSASAPVQWQICRPESLVAPTKHWRHMDRSWRGFVRSVLETHNPDSLIESSTLLAVPPSAARTCTHSNRLAVTWMTRSTVIPPWSQSVNFTVM